MASLNRYTCPGKMTSRYSRLAGLEDMARCHGFVDPALAGVIDEVMFIQAGKHIGSEKNLIIQKICVFFHSSEASEWGPFQDICHYR